MTTWREYLADLGQALSEAEQALAAGDLERAAALVLDPRHDQARAELPPLEPAHAAAARRTIERMAALDVALTRTLGRLQPQMALLGAAGAPRALPHYLDTSA